MSEERERSRVRMFMYLLCGFYRLIFGTEFLGRVTRIICCY